LMIVVAIIGILAALAIYGVKKYLTNAKSGEAKNNLGRMGKDAVSAYERESMAGTLLDPGGTADAVHRFCESATAGVPATVPVGQKMQPDPLSWQAGSTTEGWKCLRFSVNSPVYYQYNYTSNETGSGAGTEFTASAVGNLDGDTVPSDPWQYRGGLITSEGGLKTARLAPTIIEPGDPEE
jgi:type IV pilus assembly protein PilA